MLVCIEQMTTELNSWTSGSAAAHKARHNATLSMHCVIFTNTVTNLSNCHTCITLLHLPCCLHCATPTSCVFIVFHSLRYPYNVVLVRVLLVLLSHSCSLQPLSIFCPTDATCPTIASGTSLVPLSPLSPCTHVIAYHVCRTITLSGQVANSLSVRGANFIL